MKEKKMKQPRRYYDFRQMVGVLLDNKMLD